MSKDEILGELQAAQVKAIKDERWMGCSHMQIPKCIRFVKSFNYLLFAFTIDSYIYA